MKLALTLATVSFAGAPFAAAQVTAIGPFQGQFSEGFETQASHQSSACVVGRVFDGRADLCTLFGNEVTITGYLGPGAILPRGGVQMFHTDVTCEIRFDQPARRFGGWFGTSWVTAGNARLYDPAGNPIESVALSFTPCSSACTWVWNGWEVQSGPGIGKIEFDTATATGGHFELDDLEVTFLCEGNIASYCTGKLNSLGCTPSTSASGQPSASAASGFVIRATDVQNNKAGILLYGVSGRAALPFQGGTLCIALPIRRTPGVFSGGSVPPAQDCSGVFALDMNAFAAGALGGSPVGALGVAGTVVATQFWGRDPGFAAPNNTTLSNGLEYTICP